EPPRKRAVRDARDRTQAEKGDRPERHDPSALRLGHTELEPRRRRSVRREVADAGEEERHESERQPRRDRERKHAAAEQRERDRHPPSRASDTTRNGERRYDRARSEDADDRAGERVVVPERVRERRRLR